MRKFLLTLIAAATLASPSFAGPLLDRIKARLHGGRGAKVVAVPLAPCQAQYAPQAQAAPVEVFEQIGQPARVMPTAAPVFVTPVQPEMMLKSVPVSFPVQLQSPPRAVRDCPNGQCPQGRPTTRFNPYR